MEPRFFTAADVRSAISMSTAMDAVRGAFLAMAAGEFNQPPRTRLDGGRFLVMSAHHVPTSSAVVKSLSLDFDRRPAVEGALAYLSVGRSGTIVLDAAGVTALRTGAVVGVATDVLAPPAARHLVLVGLGALAPDQLRAVRAVRPIEKVTLVARRSDQAVEFRAHYADELANVEVVLGTTVDEAVGDADIVCCATPSTEPLFRASALPERVHVNAVGAYRLTMRELPDELLGSALVVVDQREAALEESGEIHHAIGAGLLHPDDLVELSDVLGNRFAVTAGSPGRAVRTVFKSVGLAIQDWAVAHALARGI